MKMKTLLTISILLVITPVFGATPSGPELRLFPTTILDDLNQTTRTAEEMEHSLQDVIARLDLQQQLYVESRCEGADEDPGCERIKRQLGAAYLEMLEVMEDRLPDMDKAVNDTLEGLEKQLSIEIGQKTTPHTLQETLLGLSESAPGVREAESLLRGERSGFSFSQRFQRLHDLVATPQSKSSGDIFLLGAEIYLDLEQASYLIAATRQAIARATLIKQLNQSFGEISPEMSEIVSGVKSILFGEEVDFENHIASKPESEEAIFISPLEI